MTQVYLSLGSNLSDRRSYLEIALKELSKLPQTQLKAVSSFYETKAWGNTNQNDFLNACCELETSLPARELLTQCQAIEKKQGRVRKEHWGPRTLDIDLLIYGDEVIETSDLTVPHPYLTQRAFVLVPLNEIAPSLEVEGGALITYLQTVEVSSVRKLPS